MIAKPCKDKEKISLSSGEEKNYKNDIRDNTDPKQAKDKYPPQLLVIIEGKLQTIKKKGL